MTKSGKRNASGSSWSRETSLTRRGSTRPQRFSVLGVATGDTEEIYLKALAAEIRGGSSLSLLRVAKRTGAPKNVVDWVQHVRREDDYDLAFIVCDVDDNDVAETEARLQGNLVRCAWSDPCFEVWLLWHVREYTTYIESSKAAMRLLERALGRKFEKSSYDPLPFLRDRSEAARRAKAMMSNPDRINPRSLMYLLIDVLDTPPEEDPPGP